jgi:hypothetical protein
VLHKNRNGHPGAPMISLRGRGMRAASDVLAYAQTRPVDQAILIGNMTSRYPVRSLVLAPIATALAGAALAGRPLTVDDAGTNAAGEGHVEVWMVRAKEARSWNISPAYALRDGLEISALLSRERHDKLTTTAIQLKYLFSPSNKDGCNFGVGVGVARASADGQSEDGSFVNGIASCNGTPLGNAHLNVGYTKPSSAKGAKSWGMALEHEMGAVTPHVEYFGVEHSKPVVQLGLRGDIARNVLLDGTVGRFDGVTGYSVGFKFKF